MNFDYLHPHTQNTTWVGRMREQAERHLPKVVSGNVLDVGCSVGVSTIELANTFPNAHVYGIDYNEEILHKHNELFSKSGWSHPTIPKSIKIDEKPKNYSLVCVKSPKLPFKENFFELICDTNNLYYAIWKMINSGMGSKGSEDLKDYFKLITPHLEQEGEYYISGYRKKRIGEELPYEFSLFTKSEGKLNLKQASRNSTPQLELIIDSALTY
ncbi:MAG: methyltransferase domain-containing protein [Candidatus Nanoarchaeia archaeon]